MRKISKILLSVILILSLTGCAISENNESISIAEENEFGAKTALEKEEFTIEEMLQYAIQDEYLARQEYELIIEEYGEQNPFSNIIKAEEKHIELLKEIYKAYEYDIPEDLAMEHAILPDSLDDTFVIGVLAEADNIAMYEKFLDKELPYDIREVFIELRDGSISHLAAFEKGPRGNGRGR